MKSYRTKRRSLRQCCFGDLPGAALLAASLASCLGFDQWVFAALRQSSLHWDANTWIHAFTHLGRGWLQVELLLVWLLVSHRRRDVLTALLALVLAGVVGIPAGLGLSKGTAEILLLMKTYGVPVLSLFSARRVGEAMKTVPDRVLSFLTRYQSVALCATFSLILLENTLTGRKPRELLPLDEQSMDTVAFFGLFTLTLGVLIRLWSRMRSASARDVSLGIFLILCGLLCQLRDQANWFVALPVFALFYGVPSLGEDRTMSRVLDAPAGWGRAEAFFTRLRKQGLSVRWDTLLGDWRSRLFRRALVWALILLLLPFVIELLVEDFVFEDLLRV
jgi:hypothetical protein